MSDSSSSNLIYTGSQICSVVIWTALSIAMIVIGTSYIDKCSIEPMIPIYLIVAGAVHLVGFVLLPLKLVFEKLMYAIEGILVLFSLCWFIAGSVWVFRIYQVSPRDCDDTVYTFAFRILIFEYVFLCLAVFLICLRTCCGCGLGLRSADTNEAAYYT
ncbi:transmembrane protein 272-like isoform X2 [Rana temporaria]|uniref:transmembrane protein 272-like isoform X2 n=1 Tax=Rana temporaria TaxID=8407 RepID=UPI001AADBB95|nr:transmembrane protein 272-like isoform X2 [Rana temporaria]XP_040184786.1 transmembrane protein 272-like isoform X2 [Rana temporaria]XP_040184787.1 transmembrane protein 272-like isoform X2 [Rana temporaria]